MYGFHDLAGSKASIYQTVHEGRLVSLIRVIDHPQEKLAAISPPRALFFIAPHRHGIKKDDAYKLQPRRRLVCVPLVIVTAPVLV